MLTLKCRCTHTTLVLLLIISAILTGCAGSSDQVDPFVPDELEQPSEDAEPISENVSFWGFDQGAPEGWEYAPEWTFEDGVAQSSTPGVFLFTQQGWQDFRLFTRLEVASETAFELVIRAREEGAYHLLFEPGLAVFITESGQGSEELLMEGLALEPGWHEIHLVVQGQTLSVELDGKSMLETELSMPVAPGSVGFINHSSARLAVDFLEVHDIEDEGEVMAEEPQVEEAAAEFDETFPDIVIHTPPVADLIEIGAPDQDFNVTVSGEAGAAVPGSLVCVANLDTTRVYFTDAAEDGSFQLDIRAHPGAAVQIKHAYPGFVDEERDEILAQGRAVEIVLEWVNATTGTIVRVPDSLTAQPDAIPFAVSGQAVHAHEPYWYVEGLLTPIDRTPDSMRLKLQGTLALSGKGLVEQIDLQDFNAVMSVSVVPHFHEDSTQAVVRKYLVSDFLTPTGFPIYHGEFFWTPFLTFHPLQAWRQISTDTISVDFELELVNEEHLPIGPGYYGVQFGFIPPDGFEGITPDGPTMRDGALYANGGAYGPLFRLGDPAQPRLHWGLLTDTLHEATRGTTAREDQDDIGLIPMISFQDEKFVIPKDDPKIGQPLSYRLEPFLPLIAYGDRGLPNPPTIDFAFPSGELRVVVHRPDGQTDVLGPAPFVQSVNTTPSYDFGKVKDYSNGGGAMQEVYQLTTLDQAFDYTFEQYGRYEIEMTGTIEDMRGNVYLGGGTYDLYVAKPLKLYNGVLPTTPFIEGDAFSPSLQVYPRFPVDVDMRLTFLPESSVERKVTQVYEGRANAFGYFYPHDQAPYTFQDGGEYRVDVTTQYTDEQGALWMGSATWGNVVENAGTRIIAHGIRGLDSPDANNLWFFHFNLNLEGIFHTFFPYYSGDVFWGFHDPRPDSEASGADAIIPGASLEDTSGTIYGILKRNFTTKAHAAIAMGDLEDAIADDEVIPFSTTSSGMGLEWFPEQIDQYGYAYMSSERPGARVHESLGEGGIPVSYWRYDGTYGDQVGVEGDLPNDLKWQYAGVVFRDQNSGIRDYGAYASLWVLVPNDDPMGARVTPPFQGATGGPNGGPILTLKGEQVDLFFLPRSGFPGQILQVGEILSFSGHVGPPLDSKLTITVTSPSGREYVIMGQANRVGYFYQPQDDLVVEEAGVWQVEIEVVHDGMTSSGPTVEPYPTGGVLGAAQGSYEVFVVEGNPIAFESLVPEPGHLTISGDPIAPIEFAGRLPDGFGAGRFTYMIAMPGFILEQGEGTVAGGEFKLIYDPERLNEDYPNLDLTAYDHPSPGLADQVWITILFEADGRTLPLMFTLHGQEVFHR